MSERIEAHIVFPAYHMNKKHWYSVFLDDRLTDEEIMEMVDASFAAVK